MELFDRQWKNSIFNDEDEYPGVMAYFNSDDADWEKIQKHLANEYEPWDISESDYWVYIKFEGMKRREAKAMREMLQRIAGHARTIRPSITT